MSPGDLAVLLEFVERVARLTERAPTSKSELRAWQEEAVEAAEAVRTSPTACELVSEVVWHYLADVDIRFREKMLAGGGPAIRRELEAMAVRARSAVDRTTR